MWPRVGYGLGQGYGLEQNAGSFKPSSAGCQGYGRRAYGLEQGYGVK